MSCNYPGRGIQAPNGALTYYGHLQISSGKVPNNLPPNYKQFPLPCGKCAGCKLERSRQWAVRLMHEAQQHERTAFINLTYAKNQLPKARSRFEDCRDRDAAPAQRSKLDRPRTRETRTHENNLATLSKADLRGFTKRLNEHARRKFGVGVKYYACGEYGEKTHRPHYHIAVYGEDFREDRVFYKKSNSGFDLFDSATLTRLWPHGHADFGDLTFESAAYIARYIMKKITGPMALNHYKRVDREGNDIWLQPEFNVMSRRPGLAREWFLRYKNDVYPTDQVIVRGHAAKPPRYYDKLLEQLAPYEHLLMKEAREAAPHNEADQTNERLQARETVMLAKLSKTKRSLE